MAEAALVPFDDRDGFIWMDGKLVPWRDATFHMLTHGLHYASAVFEGERCYNGTIYAWLPPDYTQEQLEDFIYDYIQARDGA